MAKLDRLLNLTAALLETRVPMTAEEIRTRVPGYSTGLRRGVPPCVRARQGRPARAGHPDRDGDASATTSSPGRPTRSNATATSCPTPASSWTSSLRSSWRRRRCSSRGSTATTSRRGCASSAGSTCADGRDPGLAARARSRRRLRCSTCSSPCSNAARSRFGYGGARAHRPAAPAAVRAGPLVPHRHGPGPDDPSQLPTRPDGRAR